MPLKKIESMDDLKRWVKAANACTKTKEKVDLQDEFAHTDPRFIANLTKDFSPHTYDKREFMFAVWRTMDQELFWEYVKMFARRAAEEIIREQEKEMDASYQKREKELSDRSNRLSKAEATFQECKKPIFKRFRKLYQTVERLKDQNSMQDQRMIEIIRENSDLLEEQRKLHHALDLWETMEKMIGQIKKMKGTETL